MSSLLYFKFNLRHFKNKYGVSDTINIFGNGSIIKFCSYVNLHAYRFCKFFFNKKNEHLIYNRYKKNIIFTFLQNSIPPSYSLIRHLFYLKKTSKIYK